MKQSTTPDEATALPSLSQADDRGYYPAVEFTQVSIARDIIRDRTKLGLTCEELASLAKVSVATLARIESGKVTPSVASIERIDAALKAAQKKPRAKQL